MSNSRRFVVCSIGLALVCSAVAWAQDGPAKPGPEHEALGYFVGSWSTEGQVNDNPMMPAGPFTGMDKCDWFDGKFAVVCKNKGSGPMGDNTSIGILSYSSMAGVYTYYGIGSDGMAMTTVPRGTRDGKTWVYNDDGEMGKNRYTIVQVSDTSYTFEWEVEGPDGWMTIMEGKSTKN